MVNRIPVKLGLKGARPQSTMTQKQHPKPSLLEKTRKVTPVLGGWGGEEDISMKLLAAASIFQPKFISPEWYKTITLCNQKGDGWSTWRLIEWEPARRSPA